MLLAPAARAIDTGDILVASVKGEVHVVMSGTERAVKPGSVIEPPATVRTGPDGAIELRQGRTSVSVGPDTLLEFPALQARGGPIDRIIQPSGSAFYDVGKREGRKLRVETPYLVGVVKGTQFNVAVQPDGTTISLFEGLLDVRASDESSAIDLRAGEIASRKRDGKDIGVMKMDAPVPPRPATGANRGPGAEAAPARDVVVGAGSLPSENHPGPTLGGVIANDAHVDVPGLALPGVSAVVEAGPPTGAVPIVGAVGVDAPAVNVDLGANEVVGAGAAVVDPGSGADVVAPAVAVDLGPSVAAGAGTANVDISADVNTGGVATEIGAGVGVDPGGGSGSPSIDLGSNANVNAGAAAADVSAGATLEVGGNTGVSANVDLGVTVGGVDAGVTLDVGDDGGKSDDTLGGDSGNGKDKGKGNDDNIVDSLLDTLTKGPKKK